MFFGHQSGIFAETGVASPHHTVGFKAGPFYVQANSIDFFIIWSTSASPLGLAHTEVWRPYDVFIGVSVRKRVRYCMAPSVSPFKLL